MHRPTYFARKGRASNLPTRMTCVRNLVAHTKLKVRQPGQGGITGEVQTDQLSSVKLANSANTDDLSHHSDSQSRIERMREQLLAREKEELNKIEGSNSSAEAVNNNKRATNKPVAGLIMNVPSAASENYDDRDIIDDNEEDDEKKNTGTGGDDGFDSSEYEESDEDDSDDEAALMAELEKIRAERASAQQRREAEEAQLQELARRHAAATGNPLLDTETLQATSSGMQLKRKWNDDVVFHNQARNEPVVEKRFINDTVRSDFHRSFMRKYIK